MRARLSDDAIMRELAHMNQVLTRRARTVTGGRGATFVLAILAGHEEAMAEGFASRNLSQVEIAEAVGMRPQSLGPLIAQLEREGCIERFTCEDDRRAQLVALTERGCDRAQDARAGQRAFATDMLSALDEEERVQLSAIVQKLNASLG